MDAFSNHLPVRIRFGDGVLADLALAVAREGVRRPLVALDGNVAMLSAVRAALAALDADDVTIVIMPPGEPTLASVDELGERVVTARADGVVAIGGGAVLDAAKGARLVATHGGPIRRYTWPGTPEPVGAIAMALVAIPTTAGTGSEVTGGVVMVDTDRRIKVAAPSPHNRATWALVDPTLTHGLPPAPTLYGGVDALAQSLSPTVTLARTPIGDGIGLEGVRHAAAALPAVIADPADAGARSRMACASLLGGLAMNVSEAGSEHSLAHPLGSVLGLPHGLTVGLVLAESIEHDRRLAPDRFERVADALGEPADGTGDGSRAVRAVRRILATIGFPTMREAGVREDDLPAIATLAIAGWIPVSPGPWTEADALAAYRRAYAVDRR